MREEYDFTNAVRGHHAERYAQGVEIEVLDEAPPMDGLPERSDVVRLDPDVGAVFPDSQAVNGALRLLMRTAENLGALRKVS